MPFFPLFVVFEGRVGHNPQPLNSMPSLAVNSFNPYSAHVLETPVMGSFPEVWEGRQASDIVLEDAAFKSKSIAPVDEGINSYDCPATSLSNEHTMRIRLHNPYSLTQPLTEVYSCTCGMCANGDVNSSYDIPVELPCEMPISKFMPPAPPRLDTYDVIVACGAVDPDTIVYNMMMRWYNKASKAQSAFNLESECPPPSPAEYSFAEWCEMVNAWWFKNFEHRQKKVVPQPQQHSAHHQNFNNNARHYHQRRW